MPLLYGDMPCTLYRGDKHPAELYYGGRKIAGYTEQEHTGTDWTAETVYKDNLAPEILGRCWQANNPSPDYPQPILSSGGSNVYANDHVIPLPDGFGGLRDYRDRLYVDGGRVWWEKKTDENELKIEASNNESYWNVTTGYRKIAGYGRILVSHFPKGKFDYNVPYKFIFTVLSYMANYGFTKKQDLIDYLAAQHAAGAPVTVRYALAAPETIDITSTPTGVAMLAASTAPGTVHVYSDAADEVKPTITASIKLPD